jgi:hypothetical protein
VGTRRQRCRSDDRTSSRHGWDAGAALFQQEPDVQRQRGAPSLPAELCAHLLPSMLQGNIAWDDEYCYIDGKFREKVTESPGFQWVDEAKPHHLTKKEGFVATKPGAYLLLTVNTAETTQADVRFQPCWVAPRLDPARISLWHGHEC